MVRFGLEAQGDWTNIRTSRTSLFFPADTWTSKIDGLGLFTGWLRMERNPIAVVPEALPM
jgi:hypothetical protein